MHERTRSPSSGYTSATAKMANDLGPRRTMFVLVVVIGCFAILWPKVFYPMLVGSANQHIKPSKIDKTTGCCDVFSEVDIDTIKIMSELCSNIIQQTGQKPLSGKEIVTRCKTELKQTCGIDISDILQEQFRLGLSVKQILSEVRSLNGSMCLKYHYGVAPWRLGVPHRIAVNITSNVKQERPPHMRADIVHPAFREKGSAIPKPTTAAKRPPKIVEGRPGPMPGMRPTLGGAGHVMPSSQKTGGSMSVIMPIYTVGIVIFFSYTLMKLLFKKQPDGVGGSLYPPVEPDPRFRREVFESERCKYTPRLSRDPAGKIVVNAMSALLDEVNQEIEARRKANQAKSSPNHSLANGNLANGSVPKREDQEQTSVKILGMETTASCEGGEKWNKSIEPVIPVLHLTEPHVPPQEIYLQGALPAQSQILVTESAVVTESAPSDINTDPAVVLAGKMTLSVISLDSMHENEKTVTDVKPSSTEIALAVDITDVNGDPEEVDEEPLDESKYTTASGATVAENEVSEDEGTDNEVLDEEVIEKISDLEIEMNHIPCTNGTENEDYIEEDDEEVEVEEEEIEIVVEAEEDDEEDIEEIEIEVDDEEEIESEEDANVKGVIEIDEEVSDEDEVEEEEKVQDIEIHKEQEKVKYEEEIEMNLEADEEIINKEEQENKKEIEVNEQIQRKYEEKIAMNVEAEYKMTKEEEKENIEEIEVNEPIKSEEKVKAEDKIQNEEVDLDKILQDERIKEADKVKNEERAEIGETIKKKEKENEEEIEVNEPIKSEEKVKVEDKIQNEEVDLDKILQDERIKEADKVKNEERAENGEIIKKKEKENEEEIEANEPIKSEEKVKVEDKIQNEEVDLDKIIQDERIKEADKVKNDERAEDGEIIKKKEKENAEEIEVNVPIKSEEKVKVEDKIQNEEVDLDKILQDERIKEADKVKDEERADIDDKVINEEIIEIDMEVKDEEAFKVKDELKVEIDEKIKAETEKGDKGKDEGKLDDIEKTKSEEKVIEHKSED